MTIFCTALTGAYATAHPATAHIIGAMLKALGC